MHFTRSTSHEALVVPLEKLKGYKRLLLALSGGPDSMALFHCLRKMNFSLGVAHVDHGWRKESAEEAKLLQQWVEKAGFPFYLKTLDPQAMSGNLEQACREARFQFFRELCEKENYEAVLLAHHRDDLAETVLKRLFEGASWQGLVGMRGETFIGSLTLLRPWLDKPKDTILQFLEEEKISFFHDSTNFDARFLRGRMRSDLFPLAEKHFGKSISGPLARLSHEVQELNRWMGERFEALLKKNYLNFNSVHAFFERRWILKEWFKGRSIDLSYQVVETILNLIEAGAANKQIVLSNYLIEVDRQKVFLRVKSMSMSTSIELQDGLQWGNWLIAFQKYQEEADNLSFGFSSIEIQGDSGSDCDFFAEINSLRPIDEAKKLARWPEDPVFQREKPKTQVDIKRGWEAAWEGELCVNLPEGPFQLGDYRHVLNSDDKKRLQKLWTDAKVPAFMRSLVPVISREGHCVQEFLTTGKGSPGPSVYLLKLKAFTSNT